MPISKLVDKLWETVGAKSLSALCKPGQIRREGIASIEVKRKEMLILAQTEKEIEEVKSGKAIVSLTDLNNPKIISLEGGCDFNDSDSMEPYINIENLTKTVSTHFVANEIKKEINIAKSLFIAEDLLCIDQSEPPQQEIEDDWLSRWRDNASQSSSEKIQDLWGRILAGEIKSPGTFSLRTLEFIKNLSTQEAQDIQTLLSFEFSNIIIKNNNGELKYDSEHLDRTLNFDFLVRMQALGLISGVDAFGLTYTIPSQIPDSYGRDVLYQQKTMRITNEDKDASLRFNAMILTPLGLELRSICSTNINDEYLNFIINTIKSMGFKVCIGDTHFDEEGARFIRNLAEV